MNLQSVKQSVTNFFNSKLGVVLAIYFSLRLVAPAIDHIMEGGVPNVLLGLCMMYASCRVFTHFYNKVNVNP